MLQFGGFSAAQRLQRAFPPAEGPLDRQLLL